MMIHLGRHRAEFDDDVVVFLIGARVNKLWKLHRWLPVARAMARMQKEIGQHPEIGCLHIENFGGLPPISVQYWRSFEDLERFARSNDWSHLQAWRSFNRVVRGSGDVGIWHETYRVPAGEFEAVYSNMPEKGLAAAGRNVAADLSSTAAQRIGDRREDNAPVEAY